MLSVSRRRSLSFHSRPTGLLLLFLLPPRVVLVPLDGDRPGVPAALLIEPEVSGDTVAGVSEAVERRRRQPTVGKGFLAVCLGPDGVQPQALPQAFDGLLQVFTLGHRVVRGRARDPGHLVEEGDVLERPGSHDTLVGHAAIVLSSRRTGSVGP